MSSRKRQAGLDERKSNPGRIPSSRIYMVDGQAQVKIEGGTCNCLEQNVGLPWDQIMDNLSVSMLTQNFTWSKSSALMVKAVVNGNVVSAIVDTGSSGVVLSELCIKKFGLTPNEEVEFKISTASATSTKKRPVFHNLKIIVGTHLVVLPALVM